MKLISHRGNLIGKSNDLENHPDQIMSVLDQDYDCEIDLWVVSNQCYLGHDAPTHKIDWSFLEKQGLWIHAKNIEALYALSSNRKLNFFWHQEDDFTLTSQGYIWTYPGKPMTTNSVMVLPEWQDPDFKNLNLNCYGICSDYITKIKEMYD
jgi:hypothetical protein